MAPGAPRGQAQAAGNLQGTETPVLPEPEMSWNPLKNLNAAQAQRLATLVPEVIGVVAGMAIVVTIVALVLMSVLAS